MKIRFRSAFRHVLSLLVMTFLMGHWNGAHAASPKIASGLYHTLALTNDGTVYAWGSDLLGQLGQGSNVLSTSAVATIGLPSISKLASYGSHSVALDIYHRVWVWGDGSYGELADGHSNGFLHSNGTPALIGGLLDIVDIAVGDSHCLALKSDGSVWVWGASGSVRSGVPIRVLDLPSIVAIAAGVSVSYALGADGRVWAWGLNYDGQLGDGTTIEKSKPVQVNDLSGVVALSAGFQRVFALKHDGSVWAWGNNFSGALGDGTTSNKSSPVQVAGIQGVLAVAIRPFHTIALKSDGTVWAWGFNYYGELGDGSTTNRSTPVEVMGVKDVVALGGGWESSYVVKSDGTVWAWGSSYNGELGDGTVLDRLTPVQLPNLESVMKLASGSHHSLALLSNGNVMAWGSNVSGQLGTGRATFRTLPSPVLGLSRIVDISAGEYQSLALKDDGSVYSWGLDTSIARAAKPTPTLVAELTDVVSLAAGSGFNLALKRDKTVWVWGRDFFGSGSFSATPIQVPGLTDVLSVVAGDFHSLALKSDGSVWAWGRNNEGQLGDGTATDRSTPVQTIGLSNIVALAGGDHSLALQSDGAVWAWGRNFAGQLGDGKTTNRLRPTRVVGLSNAVAVGAGFSSSYAVGADGSIWAWGSNYHGELGDGTTTDQLFPKRIARDSKGIRIFGGRRWGIFAVKPDGNALAWGYNSDGELGDATLSRRLLPVLVVNSTGDGYLNLANMTGSVSLGLNVPFFTVASGGISDNSASVSTTTKFNPADKGKPGSVFVTAIVPSGSLGATTIGDSPPNRVLAATPQALASTATCPAPINPLTLVQLTPTGWQTVVNGQLIPYASGVLGDQLAAQTILNGTDTTNLKGAEFCVGYGTSAEDMVNNGNIRAVATIPGATTTSTCVVGSTLSVGLSVAAGWNLLGNPINQSIGVSDKFGDASKVNSVWKWDTTKANWQFYAPGLDAASLQSYVTSQGYGVLVEISPGDGYWVQAKVQADLGSMCGTSINLRQSSLSSGWNLVSTASPISAKDFNLTLSTTPPTAGQVPVNMTSLWAWDANQANWYFYAPSLDAQGGSVLSEYISGKTYKDFTSSGKTLGNGVGIWVNRP